MRKIDSHVFQGMQRDMSISKQQPQFLWDAHNIRLTAREGDTLMSITNERGTKEITLKSSLEGGSLLGSYVGHCVLGDYLTVFTHATEGDYIFRILKESENTYTLKCLTGEVSDGIKVTAFKPLQLGFDVNHPLQTLGVYENKFIQKVYWTDGINQPRVINIVKDSLLDTIVYNEDSFDFVPRMQLEDSITVRKIADSSASFGAGVIQYFISYYNKYGQESNISCASPLIPTSFSTRAGNAEEKIGNAFEITVNKPDNTFEYLRIYSIFRSSLDATPSAKRVVDIKLGSGGASANTQSIELRNPMSMSYINKVSSDFAAFNSKAETIDTNIALQEATVPGVNVTSSFYVFRKSDYPSLYISSFFYVKGDKHPTNLYITWGNATTLYVSAKKGIKDDQGYIYDNYCIFGTNEEGLADFIAAYGIIKKEVARGKVTFIDNGTVGDDIDAQELLYIGGESITAETIEQKDGTLFFGNVKVNRPQIAETLKTSLQNGAAGVGKNSSDWSYKRYAYLPQTLNSSNYKWSNSLNAKISSKGNYHDNGRYIEGNPNISTAGFKWNEHYRLGVQFQYKTGKWSEPIFLGDKTEANRPGIASYLSTSSLTDLSDAMNVERLTIPTFATALDSNSCKSLIDAGYVRARAVIVQPEARDRLVIAQGMLAPSVYSVGARKNHAPDFQSSWFFRPWGVESSTSSSGSTSSGGSSSGGSNTETITTGGTFKVILNTATLKGTLTGTLDHVNEGSLTTAYTNGTFEGTYINTYTEEVRGTTYTRTQELDATSNNFGGTLSGTNTGGSFVGTITGGGKLSCGRYSHRNYSFNEGGETIQATITASSSRSSSTASSYYSGEKIRTNEYDNVDHPIQTKDNYTLYSGGDPGSEIQGFERANGWRKDHHTQVRDNDTSKKYSDKLKSSLSFPENQNESQFTVLFCVDQQNVTMHSPEFEWDDSIASLDWATVGLRKIGYTRQKCTTGDISIQVSTPQASEDSAGFVHTSVFTYRKGSRLCDGLFWQDGIICKSEENGNYWSEWNVGYLVYPWQRSGSLNNDAVRTAGQGTRTAVLERKIISNLLFFDTTYYNSSNIQKLSLYNEESSNAIAYFNSDDLAVVKPGGYNYYGNVDSLLTSFQAYNFCFSRTLDFSGYRETLVNIDYYNDTAASIVPLEAIGRSRECIRMKYKSTPHIAVRLKDSLTRSDDKVSLYLAELYRDALPESDFGGTSDEALESNLWIPAGDPVKLSEEGTTIYYDYGDTWYQRYDCLKTYSYTDEDLNSVVEIGSFMVEAHINIDGRYDRNRGQDSNLTMSPTNFNLINEVYSQKDNFFNYRILDSDYYNLREFPAMVTWSTAKNNASDVDPWTTVTLASTLEVDGTKGEITSIVTNKDTLYAFQERGITQILFNSRVAISTSDNVPIEISNNYKVDGNRYISTSVGCSNKFAIAKAAQGVYFIDDIGNVLYLLNGDQLTNITDTHGMGYWLSQQDTVSNWLPNIWNSKEKVWKEGTGISLYYDFNEKDLYINTVHESLCYSELLTQFVSFLSYQGGAMFNIGSTFHALTNLDNNSITFWQMFTGNYNECFYDKYQSDITFISNAENTLDKIFTNLEIRADFRNEDDEIQHEKFFDTIRVWDEYQDTQETALTYKSYPYSESPISSNLKKKFRIWRCEIPRAAKAIITQDEDGNDVTSYKRTLDRIRNTWCKIKLSMNIDKEKDPLKMEVHDVQTVYYT